MKKTFSIKFVWYALILSASVMPMLLLLAWTSFKTHSMMLENAFLKEGIYLEGIKTKINSEITRLQTMLQNKSDPMAFTLGGDRDRELLIVLSKTILSREKNIHGVYIFDRHGQPILGVDKGNDGVELRTFIQEELLEYESESETSHDFHLELPSLVIPLHGSNYIGNPELHEGEMSFDIAMPIGSPDSPLGVVLARISIDVLWETLDLESSRPEADSYIIDSRGSLLSGPPTGSNYTQSDILTQLHIVRSLIISDEHQHPDSYKGIKGVPVFGIGAQIEVLNWAVISEIPVEVITGPIHRAVYGILFIGSLLIIIFGWLGLSITKQMLGPITELSSAFNQVRDGDYSATPSTSPIAEFNTLTEGFNRMIGDIQKREKDLRYSEAKTRSIVTTLGEGIVSIGTDRIIRFVNQELCNILGHSEKELLGQDVLIMVPEKYRSRHLEGMKLYLKEGKKNILGRRVEFEGLRKDGTIFPLELRVEETGMKEYGDVFFTAAIRDITEHKRLEVMETRFGRILETSLNEIYIFDAETLRFIQVNRGAQENMGYSMDEFKELTPIDIKPEITPEAFQKIIQPLRNGDKEIIEFTEVHRRKDGSLYPVEVHLQLSSSESSPVFVAIILDITKRKQDEEKVRKLSQAVEQSPTSVIITDNEGNIEYVNPKFCKLSGYSYKEVIGQNPRFLKSGEKSPEEYKELWDTIISGKEWHGELHNKKKNGELYWEHARISPIKNPDGKITHFLSVKEDITEKKRTDEKLEEKENQLRQSQKMEAIGTLAGGIAHDFNNILTAIIGYTELTMDSLPKESDLKSNLEQVYKAGERAKDLVSHILTFSRQSEQTLLLVQLHLIFKEAIKLLRASIPSNIEISESITNKDDVVNANPIQMHQIIMNLCTNASHAMGGESGVLEIILQPFDVDKDFAASQTNLKEGKYVRLSVSDTGHGIDKTSIEKIFDPFYSTKKKEGGTGLGLSVVYGIVHDMGGAITVHSELKKGTTFHVYFPLAEESKDKKTETPVVSSVPGGSETILFVDDEKIIVDLETKALKNLGYEVISTTNSLNALEIFKTLHEKIDIVITDLTMPNMTGDKLARELLSIRPDIPIILCTGFSQIITEEKAKKIGIREFLKKPLIIKDLAALIRKVLG